MKKIILFCATGLMISSGVFAAQYGQHERQHNKAHHDHSHGQHTHHSHHNHADVNYTSSYSSFEPGAYLGGQLGWGRADEGSGYQSYVESLGVNHKIDLGTFVGWRAYLGYSFVPYFSLESGYTYYPSNTYTNTAAGTSIDVQTYSIDLVGKFILPLKHIGGVFEYFSIYAKGGGAYVRTKITDSVSTPNATKTNNAIRPTYGAGIIFDFADNFSVDASWTGIYGNNRIRTGTAAAAAAANPVPTCNLFSLGIAYKITGMF